MDATQMISDSFLESDEDENEEENKDEERRPLAKLCILKNAHIPATELPLFLGDNVLGRDPNTCTLPLPATSISKQHATICLSVYGRRGCHSEVDIEALVWDLGSMNGTRKGRLKLKPNVRYALSEGDSLMVADIPCRYVSYATDTVSSQGDLSRNSGVKTRLPDALGEEGGDTSTGGKKCVNGGKKARVSIPDQADTRKTPVRASCLSFEQTPTQPQGTLVPESDSDSDGERGGGVDRRRKVLVSDSGSSKFSPTCSTFLSPTSKIVPESEDESPIALSVSTKNRPHRHVSFSVEDTDVDVGRQQLKEKEALAIVDNSKKEDGREQGRAELKERKSEESDQHVPVKQDSNVNPTGQDDLPVSAPAVFTDAIAAFNMDSDTDVEGEEEVVASAGTVTLNTNQQADQPPNTAQFHMDSDTDVDEDDHVIDKVPKSVSSSDDNTKPHHFISVIQPEAIAMDSDTDVDDNDGAVDDNDGAVSDTASKAQPLSFQSTHTVDCAPSTQQKEFHLDSDTDADEEEEKENESINASSKTKETSARVNIKPTGAESAPSAPHSLNVDSDTDDEAIPTPAISKPPVDRDDSPLVIPFVVTSLSLAPGEASDAPQSDSYADTDMDESSLPPAGDGVNPADLHVDSDTDVEDNEVDFRGAKAGQISSPRRETTPGLLVPLLQNCSTPVQLSGRGGEDMETQAFQSPSLGSSRCAGAATLRPKALSPCSDSQGEEDFVVAETQSFVLQTRDCQGNLQEDHTVEPTQAFGVESSGDEKGEQSSRGGSFQLGLSDSSHLQGQAQAVAMESTQAFVSVRGGVNMEDTQAYTTVSNADRSSLENESNLEATQAYGADAEPARCLTAEKEDQVDLALEATQAYISGPYSDSEDQTDEDERKNTASAETQPLDFPVLSTLATAETQPMSAFEEEESLAKEYPVSSVSPVKPGQQNETGWRREHEGAAQTQVQPLSKALSVAETQPMLASDNEESSDEDSIAGSLKRKPKPQPPSSSELLLVETQPMSTVYETQPMDANENEEVQGPQRRKAKKLCLEKDQTQTLTNSELSAVETQPMDTDVHGESDEEDSIPGPRKRKAKQLQLEEEMTQSLTISEVSAGETQPMVTGEDGESDDEDSIPGLRKRKAKPLQIQDDETQPLTDFEASTIETQPMVTGENEESDDEDSIPGPRKRKAKQLQLEEETTQSLSTSEVSAGETQPMATGEDGESDDEDSIPGPRKRKAKPLQIQEEETQPLTNSEASTVETQPLETKNGKQPQSGQETQSEAGASDITITGKRGTRARLREEAEQAECSEPTKRWTRGKKKALPATRVRRGKSRPDEDEREEEEEVEPARKAKGKKSMRQQKDDDREVGTQRTKHVENNSLIKEQENSRLGEEKDVTELKQQDREKMTENREIDEIEKKEEASQHSGSEEKLEREKQEKKVQERMQAEVSERLRLEQERAEKETIEKERKAQEEKERAKRSEKEKERLERERKEKEEKEKLEREKAEREERLQREEKERKEKERKEQEEKERLEIAKRELEERIERERKEQEHQARLKSEAKEREERERLEKERKEKEIREKQAKEQQENKGEENKPKVPARGRRETRRTTTALHSTEPELNSTMSTNDDVPARRTRSRSNSSNSVNSERSASSIDTQESRGRGRGRGAKRTSEPPQTAIARNRRRTVAAQPTDQDNDDICPQGVLSRSNSENSLNSEISSCSLSSQSRGRGGKKQGRGRKTETVSIPPFNSQSDQNSTPKPATRGRKSVKAGESSNTVSHEDDKEKADSPQVSTTRGRRKANANVSELAVEDKEDPSNQDEGANEESLLPKRTARGRGKRAVKGETLEVPVAPATSNEDEAKNKRERQKRQFEANTEEDASSSSKTFKGMEKGQTTEAADEEAKDEIPVQAKVRGRASGIQAKKKAKDSPTEEKGKEESEKMEVDTVEERGGGLPSAFQKKNDKGQEESKTSVDQDEHLTTSKPQTPTSSASRKRKPLPDSSPVAKTPRSSTTSPVASGRFRAAGQAYKVLFTGVVDEAGERTLARLGGSMAKDVTDMNFLVTDKVRRTVKFLCAVAKGVPIVTTHWLEKSGKAGSFLSPDAFVVKDPEQEKKFNFCLKESLRIASSQPFLQGYEIHVTKSVKPEPVQMKDIITCSGATFLTKMPSSHKSQTVVISCEEDWSLCVPALSVSLPVVTAEFILTGILQQKLDFQTHSLRAPASTVQPAGGRGRGRKKT